MPLETSAGTETLMAALQPPGNVAAGLSAYRRELFRILGSPAALPFPCLAPLAELHALPSEPELARIAQEAPRLYDRLAVSSAYVVLAPHIPEAPDAEHRIFAEASPVPVGKGFPLAIFPGPVEAQNALASFPAPPRLGFRTFEALVLRITWANPPQSGLAWETLASLRYPSRILAAR